MKKTPTNLAASVHGRLLARARSENKPFDDLLQYYVIERFLFRLSHSKHADKFVLKGALMLQFWGGTLPRSTKDIDLSRATPVTVEQMLEIVRDCLSLEVEDDGLRFDIQSLRGEEIRIVSYHQGVRSTFTTRLGKAAIRLQIDVGFGDVITPRAMEIVYPSLLGFEEPRLIEALRHDVAFELRWPPGGPWQNSGITK